MFRIRRDRASSTRFLTLRLSFFFLAAGVWVAGAATGNRWVTGAAIVILIPALVLGFIARRHPNG